MFQLVSQMNEAFGNPKGDPKNPNWTKVRNQATNILDEFGELMIALGADPTRVQAQVVNFKANLSFIHQPDMDGTRDALCDVNVFSLGAHHFLGIDADRDMATVVEGVMSRFIKNDDDLMATIELHATKGVSEVYYEGTYPALIMKSKVNQPDAPAGKFLKSVSYKEPVFYAIE